LDIISTNDWSTYLSAQASASASLTGLVFVAVSINLSRIISVPGLVGRAAESIIQLFGVFIISTAALVPRQSAPALGVEILVLASAFWSLQTLLQLIYMRRRTGHPLRWLMSRVIQSQLGSIPFFVSGILLIRGSSAGLYWSVPGFISSLVSGVVNAWVLLVEILR
jgi:modulator of FtsH protease